VPDVRFTANGGEAAGYLAQPATGRGPGVLVLQEWWGLDDHIRSVCDRLAAAGFVALAPDLYRQDPTTEPGEAQQRMMALSMDQAARDMRAAAAYLLTEFDGVIGEHVGAVGFCLGGGLAVWAAATCSMVGATVSYYYVMPHGKPDFTKINSFVLGHFGTADEFISVPQAQALLTELRDAGVATIFEFYTGAGHAFFNDTNRLGTYDAQAAALSWGRTLAFLHDHLGG
jgi:carboxymethylenebutenolidase